MKQPSIIPNIVSQHVEEVSFLWETRRTAVTSWNYDLKELTELDQQLEANIDGLRFAGKDTWDLFQEFYKFETPDEIFAAAIYALTLNDRERIDFLIDLLGSDYELLPGFISALGWCEFNKIHENVLDYTQSDSPLLRYLGYSAAAVHRANPIHIMDAGLQDLDDRVRARSLRLVGEMGLAEKLPMLMEHLDNNNESCRFWAAQSAALLGERKKSLEVLDQFSLSNNSLGEASTNLLLKILPLSHVSHWLKGKIDQQGISRSYIKGMGSLGSIEWVPYLLGLMQNPKWARLAGLSITMITGADFDFLDFDADPPEDFDQQPNDNSEHEAVDLEEDDELIWPKVEELAAWWSTQIDYEKNKCYLMGKAKTQENLIQILKSGRQCHRISAAIEISLLSPQSTLFPVAAPGFRQLKMMGEV